MFFIYKWLKNRYLVPKITFFYFLTTMEVIRFEVADDVLFGTTSNASSVLSFQKQMGGRRVAYLI
jgi:hypothetical protein